MAATDETDAKPVPRALFAATVHEYDFALESFFTINGEPAPLAVLVTPPFNDWHTATYFLIGNPPLSTGATNDTATVPTPATAPTKLGAPGTTPTNGAAAAPTTKPPSPTPIATNKPTTRNNGNKRPVRNLWESRRKYFTFPPYSPMRQQLVQT